MNNLHETKSATRRSLEGQFLVAAPHIQESPYQRCVILVVQHQEAGALGLVLDRHFREQLEGSENAHRATMRRASQLDALAPDSRLFSGLVIWPAGHLERDVDKGIWMVTPACFEMGFSGHDLWVDLVRQIGRMVLRDSLGIWNFPSNPSLN